MIIIHFIYNAMEGKTIKMNIHVNMCKPWCFFSSINGEYTNNDSMHIIKILNHTQLPNCVFIHRTIICCSYYRDLRKSHRTQNVSFWIAASGLCRFITKEKKSLAFPPRWLHLLFGQCECRKLVVYTSSRREEETWETQRQERQHGGSLISPDRPGACWHWLTWESGRVGEWGWS